MAKQITELSDELKKKFKVKCTRIEVDQKFVVTELITLWVNGKITLNIKGD